MKAKWMRQIDKEWEKTNVETEEKASKENNRYKIVASIVNYSRNGHVFDTRYCIDVEDKELDGFNLVDGFESKNKAEANEWWKKLTAKYLK